MTEPVPNKPRPWAPICDDEYATYSVRDKIRHQLILAAEAFRKAGPMWSASGPLREDQMSDKWRMWTAQAKRHQAEAARLREYLKGAAA